MWPGEHERVRRDMASDDLPRRRRAAARLTELPQYMAASLVARALDDSDLNVKLAAARAAIHLGLPRAGDRVVGWLKERDTRLRAMACEVIAVSPTDRSLAALVRVLGDTESEVRLAAVRALGRGGDSDAVSALLGQLDDASSKVRVEVVRALGRLGDPRAVVPLVSKLKDSETDVRRHVAQVLGALADRRAVPSLIAALRDRNMDVRRGSLEALGKLGAADARPAIVALLEEEVSDSGLRVAAIEALAGIATPAAIDRLIDELQREGPVPLEEDSAVRVALRIAYGRAGGGVVARLVAALDLTRVTRRAATVVLALGALGDKQGVAPIVRAARRGAVPLHHVVSALRAIGGPEGLLFTLEHLDAPDADVRRAVVEAAAVLAQPSRRDGRAVDVVRARVLAHKTPLGERLALVRLLGRTGSQRARPVLLALLSRPESVMRVAVIDALATLGSTSQKLDTKLVSALDDDSSAVRLAAARALARVGGWAASRQLLSRLRIAPRQDRLALGIAVSGAVARGGRDEQADQIARMLGPSSWVTRDALIESLGRLSGPRSLAVLATLATAVDRDDRRKVAEVLAGRKGGQSILLKLATDPQGSVRATAMWALGSAPQWSSEAAKTIESALADADSMVAANAVAAWGRLLSRRASLPAGARDHLCRALGDARAYVRLNAVVGLHALSRRHGSMALCEGGKVRDRLRADRSWRVRGAAASLLRWRSEVRRAGQAADRRALRRCEVDEVHQAVARRCQTLTELPQGTEDVLLFVTGVSGNRAQPRAAFALLLADGWLRLGHADRRGAVFARAIARGPVELAVPVDRLR